ncbi:hypothetical protein B484DRAFT_408702 [Ochromonadaceae sp. CCMP2298]|nr:hypothetical protein B484DRAFT_408702 [Ochromonadaceae sp. CCMP2298]
MRLDDMEEQQLEHWVASELAAMKQSNPQVLARIIVSLVKGDQSEDALKAHCVEELKTFLKDKAAGFVKILFRALEEQLLLQLGTTHPHMHAP